MTFNHFVTVESYDVSLTSDIIPEARKYGLESMIGTAKNLSDVHCLSIAGAIADKFTAHDVSRKFNKKFFPHLPEQFVYGSDFNIHEEHSQEELFENMFYLKKIKVTNEDDERIGQISVCEVPRGFDLEELRHERHYSKPAVSKSFTLN